MFLLSGTVQEGPAVGSVVLPDGDRIPVGEDPVTIGRLPECDIVLADTKVSRRHAEIRRDGASGVSVVDLNSTNGTMVNGAGVRERVLTDGDQITVGGTVLRYEAS
jgi:pSer/pThr/pTyr-binding forkhead associated (FHA) protein